MPTVSNVTVGKPKIAGAVWRAPIGTTLPTTATETLNAAFKDMGFVSEDGVVNSNSPDSEKIKAWGGQTVLVVSTENNDTFQMTLIEVLNRNVASAVYNPGNVAVIEDASHNEIGYKITVNADPSEHASYVIDIRMTGGAMKRIVIPDGQISERGDITYKDDEAVGYDITVDALPDASGNNHYEYTLYGSAAGTTYAVTFNSNGGSFVPTQYVASGGTATEPDDPTKTGFTFSAWYTDTGLTNAFSFSTTITAPITLYAKWTS